MRLDTPTLTLLLVLACLGALVLLAGVVLASVRLMRMTRHVQTVREHDLHPAQVAAGATRARMAQALRMTQAARMGAEGDFERLTRLTTEVMVRARGEWPQQGGGQ